MSGVDGPTPLYGKEGLRSEPTNEGANLLPSVATTASIESPDLGDQNNRDGIVWAVPGDGAGREGEGRSKRRE